MGDGADGTLGDVKICIQVIQRIGDHAGKERCGKRQPHAGRIDLRVTVTEDHVCGKVSFGAIDDISLLGIGHTLGSKEVITGNRLAEMKEIMLEGKIFLRRRVGQEDIRLRMGLAQVKNGLALVRSESTAPDEDLFLLLADKKRKSLPELLRLHHRGDCCCKPVLALRGCGHLLDEGLEIGLGRTVDVMGGIVKKDPHLDLQFFLDLGVG